MKPGDYLNADQLAATRDAQIDAMAERIAAIETEYATAQATWENHLAAADMAGDALEASLNEAKERISSLTAALNGILNAAWRYENTPSGGHFQAMLIAIEDARRAMVRS